MRVVGLVLVNGALARVADVLGGGEVGLADVEPDRTRRAQRLVADLANAGVCSLRGQVGERRQRKLSHAVPIVRGRAYRSASRRITKRCSPKNRVIRLINNVVRQK